MSPRFFPYIISLIPKSNQVIIASLSIETRDGGVWMVPNLWELFPLLIITHSLTCNKFLKTRVFVFVSGQEDRSHKVQKPKRTWLKELMTKVLGGMVIRAGVSWLGGESAPVTKTCLAGNTPQRLVTRCLCGQWRQAQKRMKHRRENQFFNSDLNPCGRIMSSSGLCKLDGKTPGDTSSEKDLYGP